MKSRIDISSQRVITFISNGRAGHAREKYTTKYITGGLVCDRMSQITSYMQINQSQPQRPQRVIFNVPHNH